MMQLGAVVIAGLLAKLQWEIGLFSCMSCSAIHVLRCSYACAQCLERVSKRVVFGAPVVYDVKRCCCLSLLCSGDSPGRSCSGVHMCV